MSNLTKKIALNQEKWQDRIHVTDPINWDISLDDGGGDGNGHDDDDI